MSKGTKFGFCFTTLTANNNGNNQPKLVQILFVLCYFGMQKTGFLICWHVRELYFLFPDKVIMPKNDRGVGNLTAGG